MNLFEKRKFSTNVSPLLLYPWTNPIEYGETEFEFLPKTASPRSVHVHELDQRLSKSTRKLNKRSADGSDSGFNGLEFIGLFDEIVELLDQINRTFNCMRQIVNKSTEESCPVVSGKLCIAIGLEK